MQKDELIAALEKATGPDRELDLDLALAVGLLSNPVERGCWVDPGECIDGSKEQVGETFVAPAFTASIDAALTLADAETDPLDLLEEALASCRAERDGVYFLPLHICIAAIATERGEAGR